MTQRKSVREVTRLRLDSMVAQLRELVECESPSDDPASLARCADLLLAWGNRATGHQGSRVERDGLPHLLWRAPNPTVLLLGHFDTVWPVGTIAEWPLTIDDGIARGPGVFDMKAGIVQMFEAMRLVADRSRVSVLLTCDEETGSASSRELIEQEAARAEAVLLGEPSADGGAFKAVRKGVSHYRVSVTGRAAHAGLEPENGVNAGIELAHQILAVTRLSAVDDGTTVTPTLLRAGTTVNTVPAAAALELDVRAWSRVELDRVDREVRGLVPTLSGAGLSVSGGVNRYPLEAAASSRLVELARAVAVELGIDPPDSVSSGGASDGNFTAAIGIPTLDGLGAVGAHPHARAEWADVTAMPDRVALLAGLVDRLCAGPSRDGRRTP